MSHDKSSFKAGETKMKENTIRRTFLFSCLIFLLGMSGFAHAAHYTISVDSPSVREDGNLVFTVTLNPQVAVDERVDIYLETTSSGTATLSDNDFSYHDDTLRFDPGENSDTFTVDTRNDSNREPNESVIISLLVVRCDDAPADTCTTSFSGGGTATGTIINDDHDITVSAAASQNEGNSGTTDYTFRISAVPAITGTETVQIEYRTQDGTADSIDYIDSSGIVSFSSGSPNPVDINVPVVGDTLWEGDETFIFELRNENNNVDSYPATTTAIIANDDTVDVQLTTADFTVDEDDSSDITYTVEIDQDPGRCRDVDRPIPDYRRIGSRRVGFSKHHGTADL